MLMDFKTDSGQVINKKECPIIFSSNTGEETKSMLRKIVQERKEAYSHCQKEELKKRPSND